MRKKLVLNVDEQKWLKHFCTGAVYEYFTSLGISFGVGDSRMDLEGYIQNTIEKVTRYLKGVQDADASFSDAQCSIALEAYKLFSKVCKEQGQ